MAKNVKQLTVEEAQKFIEDVRSSCAEAAEMESAHDAGMFTIEAFEKLLGEDWQKTKIEVKP